MHNRVFDDRAERAILSAILIDASVCDDVATIVKPSDFYVEKNRRIYQRLLAMNADGHAIDIALLVDSLRSANELEEVGGEAYLGDLLMNGGIVAHATAYARIVAQKAMRRAMIDACESALNDSMANDVDIKELVARTEERIFAINDDRAGHALRANEILPDVFHILDARVSGQVDGVTTGFHDLDNLTGGLHGSELIILAARPSMGKTALATNIADNVAVRNRKPVLFFSLEMAKTEVLMRVINARAKIQSQQYRYGLSTSEKERFDRAVKALDESPLYVDDTSARTVADIGAIARRMKRKVNLALVVIDYLSLIEPDNSKDPRHEQVAKISRRLKGLARDLNVPVLCLAQLNRLVEQGRNNRPSMSNLRESGAVEQDADQILLIHREEYYHTKEEAEEKGIRGLADLIVAKNRNGPIGDVKLGWQAKYTLFSSIATDEEVGEYTSDFQSFSE